MLDQIVDRGNFLERAPLPVRAEKPDLWQRRVASFVMCRQHPQRNGAYPSATSATPLVSLVDVASHCTARPVNRASLRTAREGLCPPINFHKVLIGNIGTSAGVNHRRRG